MKKYAVYIIIFIAGMLLVADDVVSLYKGYAQRRKLKAKARELDKRYERLQEIKEQLGKGDKEYYEELARVELSLVKDGELEFRFTPPRESENK